METRNQLCRTPAPTIRSREAHGARKDFYFFIAVIYQKLLSRGAA